MDDIRVMPLELTILIPCLKEAETLAICIHKALSYLEESGVAGEVVIAGNGSTDVSRATATEIGARVVPIPAHGYSALLGVDQSGPWTCSLTAA